MILLWQLFTSFLKIGTFSFGGGYAMIPLFEAEIVTRYGWLTAKELINVITLSQMTPGPIAINAATLVGFQVAGFWGSVVATFAVILIPCLLVLAIARFVQLLAGKPVGEMVFAGMRPVVVALILAALAFVWQGAIKDLPGAAIALGVFIALYLGMQPLLALLLAGLFGLVLY